MSTFLVNANFTPFFSVVKAETPLDEQQLASGGVSIEECSTLDDTQPNETDPTEHSIVGDGLRHMNPGKPISPDNHRVEKESIPTHLHWFRANA